MTTEKISSEEVDSKETWRIMKNVVVLGLAFMVQYTAQSGANNLQSSINAEDGLGTASLAAVFAGLIFSNIFVSASVIKWLGTKWAIAVSLLAPMPYIAAQLWPRFWTLIPAGLLVGLAGGPLWCSKDIYMLVVSEAHNKISKISVDALLVHFLGFFYMINNMNQVWGNLISSLVLSSGNNTASVTTLNASQIPQLCGGNFLPSADAGDSLPPQPQERIQMLVVIYLACIAVAAITVAVGVDSMKRYGTNTATGTSGLALLIVTLKLLAEPNLMLLIIINIFIGYHQAFFTADFTAAFVSCAVGTGTVGFVMMTYGIANAIGCFVTGSLAKVTGRLPLICCATAIDVALFVFLIVWKSQAHNSYVLYIVAALWGLCDSVWLVQISAFYGTLFSASREAAFSNFGLWLSVGSTVGYIISPHLRTRYLLVFLSSVLYAKAQGKESGRNKTILLLVMLVIGVTMYFVVEFREHKARKSGLVKKKDLLVSEGCEKVVSMQNGKK